MTFFKLLETLLKLRKQTDMDALSLEVEKTYGQEGLRLLHQCFLAMNLPEANQVQYTLEVPAYPDAETYGESYKHALYQQLLPICQLAYLSENNGIAEEHAFKLATIFNDTKTALNYLLTYAKNTDSFALVVHDGCLFDLPDPASCNFGQWRILAQKNLINPQFKAFFPQVGALEKIGQIIHYQKAKPVSGKDPDALRQKQERFSLIKTKKIELLAAITAFQDQDLSPIADFTSDQLKVHQQHLYTLAKAIGERLRELVVLTQKTALFIPKEAVEQAYLALITRKKLALKHSNQAYKTEYTKPVKDATEDQRQSRQTKLSQLGKARERLRQEYTELSQGTSFDKIDMLVLECLNESFQHQAEAGYKILVRNGISPQSITKFKKLVRTNDDSAIPNVMIDGRAWGYPGVYLRKWDTLSDKGAAIAACLGKLTDNCQYIGGIGESCAMHGISSPNAGFYVICKGDALHPSLEDPILAQSWAWKGNMAALCLDSIEIPRKQLGARKMVIDLFQLLGHTLCHEYGIPLVNTGAQSGITRNVARKGYFTPKIHFIDYAGYCDSKSQLPLANKSMPWLLYGCTHLAALQAIIREKTRIVFDTFFSSKEVLKENPLLKQAIAFIIETDSKELLDLLLDSASKASRQEECEALLAVNKAWRAVLDKNQIDTSLIPQGACADMLNQKGKSALYLAALNQDENTFDALMALNVNLNAQDENGNTVLLCLLEQVLYKNQAPAGFTLAKRLIDAGAELDTKDHNEVTPLIIAVKNQDLKMIQILVDAGADLETFDDEMCTALYWAVETGNTEIFDYLMAKGAKANITSYTSGTSLLLLAIKKENQAMIKTLFKSPQYRPEWLTQKNKAGETPWSSAISLGNAEIPIQCMESRAFNASLLKETDTKGMNALMQAINSGNTRFAEAILNSAYCNTQLLQQADTSGDTALSLAVEKGQITIVQSIMNTREFDTTWLQTKNRGGANLLLRALFMKRTDIAMLILGSVHYTSELLHEIDNQERTVLTWIIVTANLKRRREIMQAIITRPDCSTELLLKSRILKFMFDVNVKQPEFYNMVIKSPLCTREVWQQCQGRFRNLLMYAVEAELIETTQLILEHSNCKKEDLQHCDRLGQNALMFAAYVGKVEIIMAILASPYCDTELLSRENRHGENALIIAINEGLLENAKAILNNAHCTLAFLNQLDKDKISGMSAEAQQLITERMKALKDKVPSITTYSLLSTKPEKQSQACEEKTAATGTKNPSGM